jgi:hypothetical protein
MFEGISKLPQDFDYIIPRDMKFFMLTFTKFHKDGARTVDEALCTSLGL